MLNQFKIPLPKNLNTRNKEINTSKEKNSLLSNQIIFSSSSSIKKTINSKTPKTPMDQTIEKKNVETPKKSFTPKKIKFNFNNQEMPLLKGHYFLNLRYLKKRNYIKKLSDREINFQKCLIRTKKTPMPEIRFFNKGISLIEADNSFGKIKSLVSNVMVNNDWKDNMTEREYKDYLIKTRLENTFLCSLNNNALEKYKAVLNKKEKDNLEDYNYENVLRNVSKNNENTFDELTSKLNAIYEDEQKRKREEMLRNIQISKNIIKRLYRNNSAIGRNNNDRRFKKKLKISSSVSNYSELNLI